MITTAYVAGLLTAAGLVALVRFTTGGEATEAVNQLDPEPVEDAPCPWRESWQHRTRTCLEELRSAENSTARVEALQWARRLHHERRSHAYQDREALEDAEAFWEEVNEVLRPG